MIEFVAFKNTYLATKIVKEHMKRIFLFCFVFYSLSNFAQTANLSFEKYPVFPECSESHYRELESCFNYTLQSFIFSNFNMPQVVAEKNYKGAMSVFFEVTKEGEFRVLYVDAAYDELKDELRRVFGQLPQIEPATYSGKPTYIQFNMPLAIPLIEPGKSRQAPQIEDFSRDLATREYDSIHNLPYENEEYKSSLNIPFSHRNYNIFDGALNRVGNNSHTAQKPYIYSEVDRYFDFEQYNQSLMKHQKTWLGRKWWNEHMFIMKGENYWITLDPGVDLQLGKDFDTDISTWNNTRILYTQGGLGKGFSFFGAIFESQGRFADYVNRYIESIPPAGGNPGIVPGQGVAKRHGEDAYDYPVGTGYISYSPSEYFNIQFGHGKTFLGDGYRSLLSSDNASPYPYLRVNTTFWKIKYTNTWMSLRDVRNEVAAKGSFRTKYMANHYLSLNLTKRLNLGFFESVIWQNDNDRGFDFNYLNPIVFYRAIEFATGPRGGNAMIGLTAKYKISDKINVYGQFAIDEFSSVNVFAGDKSWKNKHGYQIGFKYYDAIGIHGLTLQGEYNRVRPYTYSHNTIILNYGHMNQNMTHTLGANFSEFIGIARYESGRVFADAKAVVATRGFDFNTADDNLNYGGNIYRSEYEDRPWETGNEIGQGNKTQFFHGEFQLGYLINPANNFKIYGSVIYRNFDPMVETSKVFENSTTWLNFGIRTDLFNWYYDF